MRSADDETSGRIDEDLGVVINHGRINNRVDNVLADILVDLLLRNLFVMLCRNDDRLEADRLVVLVILNGNLGLAVCAEIRQSAVLADFSEFSGKLVSEVDGIRHVLRGLIRRIAEHHALVAGADRFDLLVGHLILSCLKRFVDAHRDIRGLLIQCYKYCAGISVKTLAGVVVSDLADGIADNLLIINNRLGCDLAGYQNKTGAGCCLTCYPAHRILCHAGIKDGIGNCIADFVGMSFRDGLRREDVLFHLETSQIIEIT